MLSAPAAITTSWVPEKNRLRGELHRLLRAAALPVDGDGGYALRQLRCEHRVARERKCLLAGLRDATEDHILDAGGVDAGALQNGIQNFGRKVGRMPAGEPAVAAPSRGTHRIDDISFRHGLEFSRIKRWITRANSFARIQSARR